MTFHLFLFDDLASIWAYILILPNFSLPSAFQFNRAWNHTQHTHKCHIHICKITSLLIMPFRSYIHIFSGCMRKGAPWVTPSVLPRSLLLFSPKWCVLIVYGLIILNHVWYSGCLLITPGTIQIFSRIMYFRMTAV